jgi:hypothetical protein
VELLEGVNYRKRKLEVEKLVGCSELVMSDIPDVAI